MRKIIKILSILFFPLLFLSILIFSYNVIKLNYQFAYQSANVYQGAYSWQSDLFFSNFKQFYNKIIENRYQTSLPKIKIYLSDQNSKKLLSNLPSSTKKVVKSYISNFDENIYMQEVGFRYRGDNPNNWLKAKKTFRVKTKKNELINGYRDFEYHIFDPETYYPYKILEEMNLINQNAKLKEIYINEIYKGLYFELVKIDENFLRKKKIMPVNIYKGENHATELVVGRNRNLFNNPGLWTKIAEFNADQPDDFSDLYKFLKTIKSNNHNLDVSLDEYIDIDYFSRFDAFLTITGNDHHNIWHNMRLVIDPWNGRVTQLIVDPVIDNLDSTRETFDLIPNDIAFFLNLNSEYIHKKYKWIYNYLSKNDVINKTIQHYESLKKNFSIIEKKEPYYPGLTKHTYNSEYTLQKLKKNKELILKIFNSNTKSSWDKTSDGFEIVVNDVTPLSNLKLTFENNKIPNWVGIDLNYDGKISNNEPKFISANNSYFFIPIIIYSNRLKSNNNNSFYLNNYLNYSKTYFKFITDHEKSPIKIESTNFFNNDNFLIENKYENNSVKKNKYNSIIFLKKNKVNSNPITLSGKIIIQDNTEYNDELIIMPGTEFIVYPNKNVIFKNKVFMSGTRDEPITFVKKNASSKPWGTIALIGRKTDGSIIDNIIVKGGSGGKYKQFYFTSMFSIHDVSNLKILNSNFSFNENYDDAIHIVYGENILLENITINNSFADAIDIDMSKKIIIKNSKINYSNNDGIDLMESNDIVISNLNITNSGDKGISVGENSKVEIVNSKLSKNKIGIAAKDKSKAKINNSNFINNDTQLAAYAKNWKYGGGGSIEVFNSLISAENNNFITKMDPEDLDKKIDKFLIQDSEIVIHESKINGNKKILGNNLIIK